ncbi:hypothetical protein CN563_09070 [Bacillus sp. AFS026049]|nr:hypothetical protein CN563_09070 [Bacillus sp. AFS026049]
MTNSRNLLLPPSWTFPVAWTCLYTIMGLLTLITLNGIRVL